MNQDFEQIRPFNDNEVKAAIEELLAQQYFHRILTFLYPMEPQQKVIDRLRACQTVEQFQNVFILPFVGTIINTTTNGITASGFDQLDIFSKTYLFMSNHRDIILDSALINYQLYEKGAPTTEIAIGDNLLIYDWITALVKLNKAFVVKRNLPVRQTLEASAVLSAFIRDSIEKQHQNIWIAQREGRSKDGDDQTQGSVLKMLNLSGGEDLIENMKGLNIVPVSISYEYDPCDYLKAHYFQLKRDDPEYKKSQNDDLTDMVTGLRGRKGRIHLAYGEPISDKLDALRGENKNAQIQAIADMIDDEIHSMYHLWPANYVAYDMVNRSLTYVDRYTTEDKSEFLEYVNEHISRLDECDHDFVFETILQMYAKPVVNKLKALKL